MQLSHEYFAYRDYLKDHVANPPWRRKYTHVTQAMAARLFGFTRQKIAYWVRTGKLPRNEGGLVPLTALEELEARDVLDEEIEELILASFHAHSCRYSGKQAKRASAPSPRGELRGKLA